LDITGSEWFSETTVSFHRVIPFCPACSAPFDVKENLTAPYKHTCSKCGNEIVVAPVSQWLRKIFPKAKILINADLQGEKKEEQVALSEPISFTCPQCGGGLIVDGKERVIPCRFCGINVYISDDLWLRLHPARVKTRWFIGFED